LAFKANVDDLRESPALHITEELAKTVVGRLMVVEPHVNALPSTLAQHDSVALDDLATALESADIVVLLVDHDAFRSVNKAQLRGKIVFDTRGLWR
jgi:UDP-N-acetyl-D-mannosaminuronic acid dehydrogenase